MIDKNQDSTFRDNTAWDKINLVTFVLKLSFSLLTSHGLRAASLQCCPFTTVNVHTVHS